jgi:glycosyltransferase involved in cell wall biosynthesis
VTLRRQILDIDLDAPPGGAPGPALGTLAIVRDAGVPVGSVLIDGPSPASWDALLAAVVRRSGPPLPGPVASAPTITVVVCTRDRAERLDRCLGALLHSIEVAGAEAVADVLVVDNASRDDATVDVATRRGVRVVREPVGGLDVARACGVAAVRADLIAFVDDDVVVDATWLRTLVRTFAGEPSCSAVTGGVLAYRLDTDAQTAFEARGGFLIGWSAGARSPATSPDFPFSPSMGVGCNMAFRRELFDGDLRFDPALDTGRPLPGGGDLDVLIQIATRGGTVLYEPSVLVFHEHRTSWKELRYQYYTWGKSWAVVLGTWHRRDGADRTTIRTAARRALRGYVRDVVKGRRGQGHRRVHAAWMLAGFVTGAAGSYRRSQRRMRGRAEAVRSAGTSAPTGR